MAAGTESVEHVFDDHVFLMQIFGVFDVFDSHQKHVLNKSSVFDLDFQ